MSGDAGTYNIELEYDDIAAVAEVIGPGVIVLGHSYGGPIAIGAATRTDAIACVIAYEGWPSLSGSPRSDEIGTPPSGSKRFLTPMTGTAPSRWCSATW
jgi:pimeloyl-ACP methyl ester carboxylesterase